MDEYRNGERNAAAPSANRRAAGSPGEERRTGHMRDERHQLCPEQGVVLHNMKKEERNCSCWRLSTANLVTQAKKGASSVAISLKISSSQH